MIVVWSPQSCTLDEESDPRAYVLVELAADPLLSADDVKATGPVRTQRFHEETFELLSASWVFRGNTHETEQEAIDAWQAWDPNALPPDEPVDEPPPEEPAP